MIQWIKSDIQRVNENYTYESQGNNLYTVYGLWASLGYIGIIYLTTHFIWFDNVRWKTKFVVTELCWHMHSRPFCCICLYLSWWKYWVFFRPARNSNIRCSCCSCQSFQRVLFIQRCFDKNLHTINGNNLHEPFSESHLTQTQPSSLPLLCGLAFHCPGLDIDKVDIRGELWHLVS